MDGGMSKDKYLEMCEQIGEEPSERKMPPDLNDFPDLIQKAIITFNKLGDKIVADIGYMGKDLTSLPIHFEIHNVEDKELFLETILILDARIIKNSQDKVRSEHEKAARASKA